VFCNRGWYFLALPSWNSALKLLFRHAADGGRQPQSQTVVRKKMKTAA